MDGIEVLVLLDVGGLEDKEKFEKHVKKEGFNPVEGEDFVYTGHSTTTTFSTKAYILEVFKKGLQKNKFNYYEKHSRLKKRRDALCLWRRIFLV